MQEGAGKVSLHVARCHSMPKRGHNVHPLIPPPILHLFWICKAHPVPVSFDRAPRLASYCFRVGKVVGYDFNEGCDMNKALAASITTGFQATSMGRAMEVRPPVPTRPLAPKVADREGPWHRMGGAIPCGWLPSDRARGIPCAMGQRQGGGGGGL